ncbi:MAG TPA: AAA family ATPase [Adlercreutzia equolifaciens]|uniref:AAA family ATPase n=1 Tax=Adlercreutzia TaxID=447020 RepID=UPI00242BDCC2|nr:AAA family ATPase [Adlercreutzia equolifaciens]HJI13235.1 AAA family ATPase [Adlercreutzia equolifaciens]
MTDAKATYENGIYRVGDVRLSDLAGRRMLPVGVSNFRMVVENAVFVDKSLLIADVLRMPGTSYLYCRPRRFGKSLNLDMLQTFFEMPDAGTPGAADSRRLFEGLAIWVAEGGRFREHCGAYPVVHFSFNDVKKPDWNVGYSTVRAAMAQEYLRHGYLLESSSLSDLERERFERIAGGTASEGEFASSLLFLTQMLQKHHGQSVIVLIDEYDAPVMAGYTYGYYDEVVAFLKGWLTGALKDNNALAVAVLTGVQRISKESIFSDLNNLRVDTSMDLASDERYGFLDAEVRALAAYRGEESAVALAREWYDGYRFGSVDVYNPWSVLSFFDNRCMPGAYWGNTSGNGVLGDMVKTADEATLGKLYRLLEPGGTVEEPLDLSVVFPDVGVREEALWSMLYLAGYLTTSDVTDPSDTHLPRRLRIPNKEVARLYRSEVIDRFTEVAGGRDRLMTLHRALVEGDAEGVAAELEDILLRAPSYYDLTTENSYHMLVLGLLFNVRGYGVPVSNREAGRGRFDIRVMPETPEAGPVLIIELKWARTGTPEAVDLPALAETGLTQASDRAYGADLSEEAPPRRWGLAFSGKNVAVATEG